MTIRSEGGYAPPQCIVWTGSFRQISVMIYGIDENTGEVLEEHAETQRKSPIISSLRIVRVLKNIFNKLNKEIKQK